MQVYTEKALKLEKTASSTSFIYLFSHCSREKPKYRAGRNSDLNHWNMVMSFFHY